MPYYTFFRWEQASNRQEKYFGRCETWVYKFKKYSSHNYDEEDLAELLKEMAKKNDKIRGGNWKVQKMVGGRGLTPDIKYFKVKLPMI